MWLSKTEDVEVEEEVAGEKPLGSPFQAASRIEFDAHGPGRASGDGMFLFPIASSLTSPTPGLHIYIPYAETTFSL